MSPGANDRLHRNLSSFVGHLLTYSVVQVMQSVCCVCVHTITDERNDLWPIYLVRWLYRSSS